MGSQGRRRRKMLKAPTTMQDAMSDMADSLIEREQEKLQEPPRAADVGPAASCLHGGPEPAGIMPFFGALMGSMNTVIARTHDVVMRLAAGDEETDRMDVCIAETAAILEYWSNPEFSGTITHDSYKVAFSCATDAVINEDFHFARGFVRTGAFLRQVAKYGQAVVKEDWKNRSGHLDSAWTERQAEYTRCLQKTRTDRGLTLYLAAQIPCHCLSDLKAA